MLELRLAIVECRYPENVQDKLLKGQYIFSLCIKEIQDHLLGEIVAKDTPEKCLLESRKVEFKIEQSERYQKPVAFGTINICNDNNYNVIVIGMPSQVLTLLAG